MYIYLYIYISRQWVASAVPGAREAPETLAEEMFLQVATPQLVHDYCGREVLMQRYNITFKGLNIEPLQINFLR